MVLKRRFVPLTKEQLFYEPGYITSSGNVTARDFQYISDFVEVKKGDVINVSVGSSTVANTRVGVYFLNENNEKELNDTLTLSAARRDAVVLNLTNGETKEAYSINSEGRSQLQNEIEQAFENSNTVYIRAATALSVDEFENGVYLTEQSQHKHGLSIYRLYDDSAEDEPYFDQLKYLNQAFYRKHYKKK